MGMATAWRIPRPACSLARPPSADAIVMAERGSRSDPSATAASSQRATSVIDCSASTSENGLAPIPR